MSQQGDDSPECDASLEIEKYKNWMIACCVVAALLGVALLVLLVLVRCRRNFKLRSLRDVVTEVEVQKERIRQDLKTLTEEREENKRRLQTVETETPTTEQLTGRRNEPSGERDRLFQDQWKSDQKKNALEREMLDRDKLLEPIESYLTKLC